MDYALRLLLTNALVAAVLAALAFVVSRLVRRPAVSHALWLLALVKLVTPPLVPLALLPGWDGLSARSAATPIVVRMPGPATGERGIALAPRISADAPHATLSEATRGVREPSAPAHGMGWLAAAALAAGALAVLGLAAWRYLRFRRLLAEAETAPAATAARAATLAARLGLRHVPPLLLVRARIPPMLWPEPDGPRLLLPRELMRELTVAETDALLAHELAHVQRRDHWVRVLELVATALFWWYPLTWWTRAALRRAEERCCDECVLRVLPRSAEAYANGLLKSLGFVSATPAAVPTLASGASPLSELELRLKEILMSRPAPRLAPPLRLALLALAAIGLAVFPTQAREDEPAPAALPAPARTATPRQVATPSTPAQAATEASPTSAPAPAARVAPAAAPAPASAPAAAAPAEAPRRQSADEAHRLLQQQRRALEAKRGQLQQQELELQGVELELAAKSRQLELTAAAARLRAEGKEREAALLEKQIEISERQLDLQRRRLQLDVERRAVEMKLEAQEKARHDELARFQAARGADARQALELARQRAESDRKRVEGRSAEERIHAVSDAAAQMARALAEQARALTTELHESGSNRPELERELERLAAALAALQSDRTPPALPARTPQPGPRR